MIEQAEFKEDLAQLALGIYERYAGKRKEMLLATGGKESYNRT